MKLAGFVAFVAVGAGAVLASVSAATPPGQGSVAPQVTTTPQGRGATPPQGQTGANQPTAPPLVSTGIIVGRVIDAGTGSPVPGATITISGGPSRTAPAPAPARGGGAPMPALPPPRILTDSEGRFAFRKLTRGNYTLTATKFGYAAGTYGRMRPDGPSRSLQLDDNEHLADVAIRIFRYASINGRITDEAGEPIVGANVRAYRRMLVAGRRQLREGQSATTDDRGIYRIFSLTPGEYVVAVPMSTTSAPIAPPTGAPASQNYSATAQNLASTPSAGGGGRVLSADARFALQGGPAAATVVPDGAGRWRGYATQYYPSSHTIAAAEPIALASGDERSGIDLVMRYVPVSTVSGMVLGPNGPAANYVLRLISSEAGEFSNEPETAAAATDATGAFTFFAVPSGQYVIQTVRVPREGLQFVAFEPGLSGGGSPSSNSVPIPNAAPPTEPLLWAQTPINVGDADVAGIGVTLQEGLTISGRFEFAGSRPKPDGQRLTQVPVMVEPANGRDNLPQNGAPSRATADGRFTTTPRLPGKYFVRVGGAPSGFIVQSVMVNGADATEAPIDLTQSVSNVVITFTDLIASVSGTVRGIAPGTDPPAVVLFPSDSTSWKDFGINPQRMRMTHAGASGAFSFGSLIRGDYFAIAIKDEVSGEWQDPAFLDVLARTAERVSLGAGEKRTIDLTVTDAKPPAFRRLPVAAPHPATLQSTPTRATHPTPTADRDHGPFVDEEVVPQVRDGRLPEAIGTGTISGVVRLEDGQRPARLARVRVTGAGFPGERAALTDDEGRYTVAWLPPGDYQVTVTKPAYLLMYYGGRRPTFGPGTTVHVNAGQAIAGIDVTLQRGAVIAGMVLDPLGQPAPGVGVNLMVFTMRDGDRVLTGAQATGSFTTNDRGEYRFYGMRPGSYVVRATPPSVSNQDLRQLSESEMRAAIAEASRAPTPLSVFETPRTIAPAPAVDVPVPQTGGRSIALSPVFYPGSTRESDAGELTVTAGQELSGVNLQLVLVPTARLEGRVIVPNGLPLSNVGVTLVRLSANSSSSTSLRRMDDAFQAVGVPAGHYFLTAMLVQQLPRPPAVPGAPPPPPPMTYWAQQEIDMNGEDMLNIALALVPSMKISGRVVFDGAPPPDMRLVQVRLETTGVQPLSFNVASVTADASGAFTLYSVTPGKYRLTTSVNSNGPSTGPAWSVLSSTIGGQDSLIMPFEMSADRQVNDAVVTVTANPAEVSGKLVDGQGRPVTGMTIVLFPTDRNLWAMTSSRVNRTTRASSEGEYRFTATLPGEYYLAVLTDLDPNDWNDAAFKEQLVPASLKVTVAKSEKKIQDMRMAK